MKIKQIRNATVIIEFGRKRFLVDPMLGDKGSFAPFPMTGNRLRNPLVELPCGIPELLDGIDAVIITHTHPDHLDRTALEKLPKHIKIFVQDEKDRKFMAAHGFSNLEIMGTDTCLDDVRLVKTPGKHGAFPMILIAGHTCGVVFEHKDEKRLYLAGDTIWYRGVRETLDEYRPEVVLLNAGGNQFKGFRPVIMHMPDVLAVCEHAPYATLVATHLEGVNHNTVSRMALRNFAVKHGFADKMRIPEDGETIEY